MKRFITDALTAALAMIVILTSCTRESIADAGAECTIEFVAEGTKALVPDETKLNDINFYIIGENGLEEYHCYLAGSRNKIPIRLLAGRKYSFYAYGNAGYDCGHLGGRRIEEMKHYMSYPDSYSHGMPVSGCLEDMSITQDQTLTIHLGHIMSKISIRIDRSELDRDVEFTVAGARIGRCPRAAYVWGSGHANSRDDFFENGFTLDAGEVSALNYIPQSKLSAEASLYMMENALPAGEKADPDLCSYIELDVDYNSPDKYTEGGGLKYRFYLREDNGYSVERGCHYHITVCPRADALQCEDSWRLDKSNLKDVELSSYLLLSPSGSSMNGIWYDHYYSLEKGSSMHIDFEYLPKNMSISLREDLVKDDLEGGRIRWEMDSDGGGMWIRSLGIACSAPMEIICGYPMNDYELIYVNVY